MTRLTIEPEKTIGQIPSENKATLQQLNEIAAEIIQKMDDSRQNKREPSDHSEWNWASEVGHPCKKFLVHARRDWKEKQPMDLDGSYRVEEGNRAEWEIKKELGNLGFQLNETQRSFQIPEIKIKGRVDGLMPLNRRVINAGNISTVPCEIKTMNPNYWESTKTIEDLKGHRGWWIRDYVSQLNIYLYASASPFGFFILKTFGKRPRILPMLLDYDLAAADFKKIEDVNRHVDAGTYPQPIPFEPQVCGMCGFSHLCQPLRATQFREIPINEMPELEEYLELKKWAARFEDVKKKLIGTGEKPGRYHGWEAICQDIAITTTSQMRTFYDGMPKEIKEPYAEKREIKITKIERIGGEK